MIRTGHIPRSARAGRLLPRLLLLNLLLALTMQLLGLLPHLFQRQLPPAPRLPEAAPSEQVAELLAQLPLAFEPAAPQLDGQARFQARALGGTLFFAPGEVLLARPDAAELRVQFLNTSPAAAVEPADLLPGRVSRFLGNDPALWQQDLPTSAALVYRQIYPGIDLRYDGASRHLKGTYLLAAGADPAPIRWRYNGATGIQLDPSGDLRIALAASQPGGTPQTLVERAPVAWQDTEGGRVPVAVAYNLAPDGSVGFLLGQYDQSQPLTIDPTLEFSTYLGGSGNDHINDIALDAEGNIYVIGFTHSQDFPLRQPALQPASGGDTDLFLLKLSPNGTTLLASTYLGGTGKDREAYLRVDQYGIAVAANTDSDKFPIKLPANFPTEPPVQHGDNDIVVARLNTSGTALLWSRYLSGTGYDVVNDMALDGQGRITLVGTTASSKFPGGVGLVYQPEMPKAGQPTPLVAQLSQDGATITFRTFLSGTSGGLGEALALDADGSIVVTGVTSGQFPIVNTSAKPSGGSDVFIARLTPGATSLAFSTLLGGRNDDGVRDLVLDSDGAIYLTGQTLSDDFAGRNPPDEPTGTDGYVVKISPDGQTQLFSQIEGGNREDELWRMALDAQRNIYLLGHSTSTNLNLVNAFPPAPQNTYDNILLIKLSSDGKTVQSRNLLGGLGTDIGKALAVSPEGRVVLGGFTYSPDLPLRNALQNSLKPNAQNPPIDAVLMIIDTAPQLQLAGTSSATTLPPCNTDPCSPLRFTWTLTSLHQLDATLAITLPAGLELVGGVSGAEATGKTLRFSGNLSPGTTYTISYNARAQQVPNQLLTTTATVETPGAPVIQRSLTLLALAPEQPDALVMIYASGDNDLHDAIQRLAISAERAAATPGVTTLLLLDGPGIDDAYLYKLQPPKPGQPNCFIRLRDPSCGGRYKFGETYQKWPDNVASVASLTDFLVSAQQAFPANRRVLSLVGHGNGWSPSMLNGQPSRHGGQSQAGMLLDLHPPSSLSTSDMARALNDSSLLAGRPLDLLFLDACNMGQIEVAYELRRSTHYLLASPNVKWSAFPYDKHLAKATIGDGEAIGRAWIANEQAALTDGYPYTYTLLKLSTIEALRASANQLAGALMVQTPASLRAAFRQVDRYDDDQNGALEAKDSTVDLGSLATHILTGSHGLRLHSDSAGLTAAATQVRQALADSVVAHTAQSGKPWLFRDQTWSWNTSAGLGIYLPLGENDDWRRRYYRTLEFGGKSNWALLIDGIWSWRAPPADQVCTGSCEPPHSQLPLENQRPSVYEVLIPIARR
ncbi:MAG: hypothetical protein OHK0022_13090 [Roseiflexaceae bacterium]